MVDAGSKHLVATGAGPRLGGAAPSKRQQRFNRLIKQVAQIKQELGRWERALPELHRSLGEYRQLAPQHATAVADLVRLLDHMHGHRGLSSRERALISEMLCDLAAEAIGQHGGGDELKAIYNRHSGGDFDAEAAAIEAAQAQSMKAFLEGELGFDFGDDDIASLDDLQRATAAQVDEDQRAAAERQAETEARKARRKKSPRQLAAEARRATETAQIGKSLQEIYRKLVLLLHPDHERDPAERARKTALMQQVNAAYERKDLLQLLELRLQFEQFDEALASSIAADRLEHFIHLLAEQVRTLQDELAAVEDPWRAGLGNHPGKLTPAAVADHLRSDLASLTGALAAVRTDLARLSDLDELRAWLRAAVRAAQPPPRPARPPRRR